MQKLHLAETPVLRIAYEVGGPAAGEAIVLVHGWPDSIRTWDRILPHLHAAGFRTYTPFLRGHGKTDFLQDSTWRSGQLSALGQDLLEFASAVGLERFTAVGHDWGARAAYIAACLEPERVRNCVALSVGWGTNSPDQELSIRQAQNYWYHWYMCLPAGERLLREHRDNFAKHLWKTWSPGWAFEDAEFAAAAAAWSNPAWADVVLHSYRVRWGAAGKDSYYSELEEKLKENSQIRVPTLVIHGGSDACNDPSTSEGKEKLFEQRYERLLLENVGHFPQRENAAHVADSVLNFIS